MAIAPATAEEQEDLREVIKNLGAGHYSADKIHHTHSVLVAAHGRKPMHPVRLGQVLIEYGAMRKAKWDGLRAWTDRTGRKRTGYMVKGWLL